MEEGDPKVQLHTSPCQCSTYSLSVPRLPGSNWGPDSKITGQGQEPGLSGIEKQNRKEGTKEGRRAEPIPSALLNGACPRLPESDPLEIGPPRVHTAAIVPRLGAWWAPQDQPPARSFASTVQRTQKSCFSPGCDLLQCKGADENQRRGKQHGTSSSRQGPFLPGPLRGQEPPSQQRPQPHMLSIVHSNARPTLGPGSRAQTRTKLLGDQLWLLLLQPQDKSHGASKAQDPSRTNS